MDAKEKSKNSFNRQAPTYDADRRGQHARALYPFLLAKLFERTYQSVLDLSCGTGEMLKQILQNDGGKKVYGIDLSENMLSVAKQKLGDSAALILGDAEHLPFDNEIFDVVYCNDSFHHYPAPEKVIAEVSRVLKDGGFFLIGDTWHPGIARSFINFGMRFANDGDVKIYSEKELTRLLSRHFRAVQWQRAGNTACLAYGEKSCTDKNFTI